MFNSSLIGSERARLLVLDWVMYDGPIAREALGHAPTCSVPCDAPS